MKEKLIALAKQKSTWVGVVAIAGAYFGLDAGSVEQLSTMIAGLASILYPEKAK